MTQHPTALTIAGSDSGGGAGIQADIKTFSGLGVFGTSAITAITAQNTKGVFAVEGISPANVAAQIKAVLEDIPPQAVKIGMLATPEIIQAVADALSGYTGPIVLDPVMVAKSGDALLAHEAQAALRKILLSRASILTPNLPEAACLLGTTEASTPEEAIAQGQALRAMGAKSVLMKGGHAQGDTCIDHLVTASSVTALPQPRIHTRNTHGTGCTLSSAIAAELAKGSDLTAAVTKAQSWLHKAIFHADSLHVGAGHGPVHHFHEVWT